MTLQGSQRPADGNLARENHELRRENQRLQGQLAAAKAASAAGVADVSVAGSVLKVTMGNGTVKTYQLP